MTLEELHTEQPEVFDSLLRAVDNLEVHYKDAQVCQCAFAQCIARHFFLTCIINARRKQLIL